MAGGSSRQQVFTSDISAHILQCSSSRQEGKYGSATLSLCHTTALLGGLHSALTCTHLHSPALGCTGAGPQSLDNIRILGCKGSVKVILQHTSMVAIEERVFSKQLHFYSCESQLAWSQNIYLKLHYKSILRTTLSFV